MRQIVNRTDGNCEVLEVRESPKPKPSGRELLIRVEAAGLNFADIQARKGLYPDAPSKPCVMGYEVSGIAEEVGSEVEDSWIGQPVVAMTRFKGQSEYVTVSPSQVFVKPDSLSYVEAAAVPVNYMTAHVLLEVMGSLQSYETVLIHNAGGGVGLAAVNIATHLGATVFGTAGGHKHAFLRQRGVEATIDYHKENWYEVVQSLTDRRGVELIIDPRGGAHWKQSYRALRSTGRLGMFGVASASRKGSSGWSGKWNLLKTVLQMPFHHPIPLMNKNKGVFGVNLGHLWHETEKARRWMQYLLEGIEAGWLNPHVDKTFAFEEVRQAHRYIEDRRNIGKVVLVPGNA